MKLNYTLCKVHSDDPNEFKRMLDLAMTYDLINTLPPNYDSIASEMYKNVIFEIEQIELKMKLTECLNINRPEIKLEL